MTLSGVGAESEEWGGLVVEPVYHRVIRSRSRISALKALLTSSRSAITCSSSSDSKALEKTE